jgi:hypothetical protein
MILLSIPKQTLLDMTLIIISIVGKDNKDNYILTTICDWHK